MPQGKSGALAVCAILYIVSVCLPQRCLADGGTEADVQPASPDLLERDFEATVDGAHTHLLIVYAPGLPVWQSFVPRANELARALQDRSEAAAAGSADGDGARVDVHMCNVRLSPGYKVRFALQEYPTLLIFPRGVSSRFFVRVPFKSNSTVAELLFEVDKTRIAAAGITPQLQPARDAALAFFEPGESFREGLAKLRSARKLVADALADLEAGRDAIRKARSSLRTLRMRRKRKPDDYAAALDKTRRLIAAAPHVEEVSALLQQTVAAEADVEEAGAGDDSETPTAKWWRLMLQAEEEAERQMELQLLRKDRAVALDETLLGVERASLRALVYLSTETAKQTSALLGGHAFLKESARLQMLTRVVILNDMSKPLLETDSLLGVNEPLEEAAELDGDDAADEDNAEL